MKGKKTGGRKKGVPNKKTAEVKVLARIYTQDAIDTLAKILAGRNKTLALAAARELLDRGWGRPMQAVEMSGPEGGPIPNEHSGTVTVAGLIDKYSAAYEKAADREEESHPPGNGVGKPVGA